MSGHWTYAVWRFDMYLLGRGTYAEIDRMTAAADAIAYCPACRSACLVAKGRTDCCDREPAGMDVRQDPIKRGTT